MNELNEKAINMCQAMIGFKPGVSDGDIDTAISTVTSLPMFAGLNKIELKKSLLFDDEKDPYQMNNLPLEENKEIVAELCREMGKELKAIDDPWYKERILSDMIPY